MITQDREPIGWEHGDLQHVLDVLIHNEWWPDLLWGEWREVGETPLIGVWVTLGDFTTQMTVRTMNLLAYRCKT